MHSTVLGYVESAMDYINRIKGTRKKRGRNLDRNQVPVQQVASLEFPFSLSVNDGTFIVAEKNEAKEKYRMIGDDVYDSDESDDDRETIDRQTIVKFLQEATMTDLLKVKRLSARKANILVQARPFESWKQLVSQ